jgi:hypothetical protein
LPDLTKTSNLDCVSLKNINPDPLRIPVKVFWRDSIIISPHHFAAVSIPKSKPPIDSQEPYHKLAIQPFAAKIADRYRCRHRCGKFMASAVPSPILLFVCHLHHLVLFNIFNTYCILRINPKSFLGR